MAKQITRKTTLQPGKTGSAKRLSVDLAEFERVADQFPNSVGKVKQWLSQTNPGFLRNKPLGRTKKLTVEHTTISALERARARGTTLAAEIIKAPDMVSAEEFAARIGTSRVTVNAKRARGEVLGLRGATRSYRYPLWQLDASGVPFAELAELGRIVGLEWALYRFLSQNHDALGGLSAHHALAQGMGKDVLCLADSVARGEFS